MVRKIDHEKAIALRRAGKSYGEIAKDLGVWKSSLSYWLRNVELPREALNILKKKSNYSKEKFRAWNLRKHEEALAENKKIRESFSTKINSISNRDLLLLGAALYWGEGYKNPSGAASSHYLSLCNSDPKMIKIFMRFLRETLKIPEDKLRPRIQIHPNISTKTAINYWTNIVNLPKEKFCITYQISRASQGKRPKRSLPYGTFEIRVNSKQRFFEIMGLLDGIVKKAT